jgi:hypothetical protein
MGDGKRIFDEDYFGGSRVSFDGWDGLNEFEKIAAKSFEDGIENTLASFPPDMSFQPNATDDDIIVTFVVRGLGDGDKGPAWQFSVREELDQHLDGCSDEDRLATINALLALVDVIKAKLGKDLWEL